ncbi:hypothetical protein AXG93_3671s1090 [Marchantia polymorpha subsp. ruderalis]|uniref:Uncharacterized protein n=1 Tax=Marchantia polymorpha subsp. ruderalis TaxID=1480154 RepID=A0A176WGN4_MARPO|nr:hypothetical protein AXG93_3671s1090 [Marchantia polymorpha subsp. ruderalis]
MARSTQQRMVLLKVPQIGLRAFQRELTLVRLNFLLWGWIWVCLEMVTKEEEISFGALFKHSKSSKNGYKTCNYKDRLRRNVAVALLQILPPHRTTYMTSWQVGFVELALAGAPIH